MSKSATDIRCMLNPESANTEVGKTLLTTALLRASASRYASKSEVARKRVFYLKPVSTGPDSESDTR